MTPEREQEIREDTQSLIRSGLEQELDQYKERLENRVIGNQTHYEEIEIRAQELEKALKILRGEACPIKYVECEEHGWFHGEEAEELRKGIEIILDGFEDAVDTDSVSQLQRLADSLLGVRDDLQKLLDETNARDSLAFLKSKDEEKVELEPSGHVWEKHKDCDLRHCPICEGGLRSCTTCCGAEASLPASCPRRKMTEKEADAVQTRTLNFQDGKWWSRKTSKGKWAIKKRA